MKNFFFLLLIGALISSSSCIKITTEAIECFKPETPQTDSLVYNAQLGGQVTVKILNINDPSLQLKMYGPTGTTYTATYTNGRPQFVVNLASISGVYTIKATNTTSGCRSDEATIQINVGTEIPTCGITDNGFLFSSSTYTAPPTTGVHATGYYSSTWTISSTRSILIQFGSKPSTTQSKIFNITIASGSSLSDNQCNIKYTSGTITYNSNSGTVYTAYQNGVYHITFCTASLRTSSGSSYSCKGNLFCEE